MKKVVSIAFCALVLCSLLLLVNVRISMATEPGYSVILENYAGTAPTVDGKWGTGEWDDAWLEKQFPTGTNAIFCYKLTFTDVYTMDYLLEFNDNTNDAGDIWRICIDGGADGGTAPNSNDNKIEITGHTTLKVYVGNGTGWAPLAFTAVTWKDSLATSTYNTASHWILEATFDKGALGAWGANPPPQGLYIGMYDASKPSQGWVQWPATSADNPSRWGSIGTFGTEIPEGVSLGVLVILSSVAVLVGSFFVRKRSRLANRPMASAQ